MKLVYWKVQCKNDNNVYSIRAKTKKDAIEQFKENQKYGDPQGFTGFNEDFAKVEKIVIYYEDSFDLMKELMSEFSADYNSEKEYIIK